MLEAVEHRFVTSDSFHEHHSRGRRSRRSSTLILWAGFPHQVLEHGLEFRFFNKSFADSQQKYVFPVLYVQFSFILWKPLVEVLKAIHNNVDAAVS